MQFGGKVAQHRVVRVGREAFHQQLIAGDAQQEERPVHQHDAKVGCDRVDRGYQQRMILRVRGALVQGDAEQRQKHRDITR